MSDQVPDNSPQPEASPDLEWLTPAMPYQDANQPNMPYPQAGTEVIGLNGIDPSQQGASPKQSPSSDNSAQTSDSGGPASWQGVNDYSPSMFYFG